MTKKRGAWEELQNRVENHFREFQAEWEAGPQSPPIYMRTHQSNAETKRTLPHINIFFGNCHLGYTEFNSERAAVEGGCGVAISQSVFGDVACAYYPFGSELANRHEKLLVCGFYHAPWEVTDSEIDKIFARLMSYVQASSVRGAPRPIDRLRVFWMQVSNWWMNFRVASGALKLLTKASEEAVKKAVAGGT